MKDLLLKTILLFFFFSVTICHTFSQDNIILVNGKKLKCQILSEDSVGVNVILKTSDDKKSTVINKKYIQSINYANKQVEIGVHATNKNEIDNNQTKQNQIANNTDFGKLGIQKFKPNRISFTVGPSFSVGDFGSSDIQNTQGGFAKTGVNFNFIYFTHKINENIGIGIKWYGNSNLFNTEAGITNIKNSTGFTVESEDSYWSSGGLLGGIVLFIPVDKVEFEFRAMTGPMALISPEIKYTAVGTGTWIQYESSTAASFGLNFGAGIDFLFSDNWSFLVNMDYLGGVFKFKEATITDSKGNSQVMKDLGQTFNVVNLTFGFGYHFGVN